MISNQFMSDHRCAKSHLDFWDINPGNKSKEKTQSFSQVSPCSNSFTRQKKNPKPFKSTNKKNQKYTILAPSLARKELLRID